jgi:hypothetical protein
MNGVIGTGVVAFRRRGGIYLASNFRIRYVAAMSVADWSASASGEKEPGQRWLGFLIHAFGSCQNHLRWTWIVAAIKHVMERHSRVKMNIIAKSEKIAVRLQKICTLSPGRCGAAAWAYSPVQVLGPAFVATGEAQQLSPRIW